MAGEHTEHEDHGWDIELPDHPARTETPWFRAAKTVAHKILHDVVSKGDQLLSFLAGESR